MVHGVFQVLANFREKKSKNQPFFSEFSRQKDDSALAAERDIPTRSEGTQSITSPHSTDQCVATHESNALARQKPP